MWTKLIDRYPRIWQKFILEWDNGGWVKAENVGANKIKIWWETEIHYLESKDILQYYWLEIPITPTNQRELVRLNNKEL